MALHHVCCLTLPDCLPGSTFLDNSNLTITNEWHVIRAIAKDDVFKSTFDVSCRVSGDSEAADADTLADLPEVGSTEEYAPAAEDSVPEADATPIADAAAVEVQAPIQDAATKETALAAEPSTPAEDSAPEAYAPVIEDAAGKAPEESVPAAENSLLEADDTPADDAAAEVADQAEEAAQDAGIEDRAPEEVELPAKDAGQETKESIQDAVPFQMSRKYGHTISAALNPEVSAQSANMLMQRVALLYFFLQPLKSCCAFMGVVCCADSRRECAQV